MAARVQSITEHVKASSSSSAKKYRYTFNENGVLSTEQVSFPIFF